MYDEPLSILFPMAGQGARFGYRFKPFISIGKQRFIEASIAPFLKWRHRISKFVCIYLVQQDEIHDVTNWLRQTFANLPLECVVLPVPTAGPAITVLQAVQNADIRGQIICCDCDHAINIDPLFATLDATSPDAIIPVWPLIKEQIAAWSVVAAGPEGEALGIAEKEQPNIPGDIWGAIGCTYFRDIGDVCRMIKEQQFTNMSQVLQLMITSGKPVRIAHIQKADFFGDPDRLASAIEKRK